MLKKFIVGFFVPLFLFVFLFGGVVGLLPSSVSAQTADQAAQRAQWEKELKDTEAEIAQWQSVLNASRNNTASLQNDAAILTAKINQAKAFIKQKNVEIAQLDQSIASKNKTITTLESKIETSQDSIADLIRKTNELDSYSLVDAILSKKNISDFFADNDSYASINRSLQALLEDVRDTKTLTEKQKQQLADQKEKENDLKAIAQTQQNKTAKDEQEKQKLIAANKSQEKSYQDIIAERQAKVAQIKAKLFSFAGGSSAIPFGTALTYAQAASVATGVDAAFILAILTQESNLGANVGKCYLTDTTSGAGVNITSGKAWSNLMKPSRDIAPFLEITSNLGLDPMKTVVSCPIPSAGGYGGAMGPAQFIASTWRLFEDRLQSTLGHFANPWSPQDAIMASAMYIGDLGGGDKSRASANVKAACKYYGTGGTTCSYGRSVANLAAKIQEDIDYLNEYGISRR